MNENGNEVAYVGLSVVENPENGQRYLIYTEADNASEMSGKQVDLYACVYGKENGRIVLDPITTEKEKMLIKTFIEKNLRVA
ncbi:MAG: DUF1292 domain-containing protein [Clostridium sp.]|nr:DUF1292 domain-containing protein [Clostridium sp.]